MSLLLALTGGGGSGYTVTANTGTYVVTGSPASILRGYRLVAASGSYTVTGQSANITRSRLLTANAGSYGVSGNNANIVYTPSVSGYTLTAASGSYTVSGNSATITFTDGGQTDTRDGYWAKQWEDIAKKSKAAHKLEKKRQKEAEIALAKTEALVAKVKEIKPIESPIVLSESATYLKNNKLIVDRVIESTYHADNEDEDLLMLW
jgi:hypothetical protein